jgi:hypothetical protein
MRSETDVNQPSDFDAFLETLLATSQADAEAIGHAARFVAQLRADSQAVIATEDADGKVRYFVLNMERASALAVMARLGTGFADAITSETNEA